MAYAIHGFGRISIEFFSKMRDNGIQPNERTFVSLLTACSVSGMVDEGWKYYDSMKRDYGIDPGIEHSGCMIDLLGQTGNLDSAKIFMDEMSLLPTARIWGSLLTASRNNRNIEFAELAAEHILSLEHDNTGCYVLLANMYAEAGRWEDVERLKYHMKQRGLRKTVACSFDETKYAPLLLGKTLESVKTVIVLQRRFQKSPRERIVGDSKVFHHFIDGNCSCRDYW
ncbi:hypothetical protein ACFX1X_003606 [Malus domestica]